MRLRKNKLSEVDKKRVPNETIEQIVHDLTDVCIKVKLKEDDSKIDSLNSMLLKAYQERKSSEEEITATIDKQIARYLLLKLRYLSLKATIAGFSLKITH